MTTLSFGREPGASALDDANRLSEVQAQTRLNQEMGESSEDDAPSQASSHLNRFLKRKNWGSPLVLISHLHAGME